MSAGSALDHLDDGAAFARRHAGRRLVEQQHLGLEAERHGDLDQPLAAIGEHVDRAQRVVGETQLLEQREGLLDRGAMTPGGAEQAACHTFCRSADRQCHVFEHAQAAEQRGDLEGADEAAPDPRRLRQPGDFGVVEQDLPGVRRQRAGHQIDEARLAGAVRPDQRVAGAAFEAEIDRVGDNERAEALCSARGFQAPAGSSPDLSSLAPVRDRNRSARPSTPPRANTTSRTINSPIQKYQ